MNSSDPKINDTNTITIIPGEWAVKKLLGPTFDEIGLDFKKLYAKGKEKIISAAIRKSDVNDGKRANLRITRDVFWNGSFTDEKICSEYFGGVLASARSTDGNDDRGVFYTDIIKSLSSQQLLLHYIIYNAANKLWIKMQEGQKKPNVGVADELGNYYIWLSRIEIEKMSPIKLDTDLFALTSKGVIGDNFEAKDHQLEGGKNVPYVKVQMTTLGIQLYSVAHNKLEKWRSLPYEDFGRFSGIKTPKYFALSLDELLKKAKLKKENSSI